MSSVFRRRAAIISSAGSRRAHRISACDSAPHARWRKAFQDYALAFEAGLASRGWKATVGPRMTDDTVWLVEGAPPPAGGLTHGRDAVLEAIRTSSTARRRSRAEST